MIRMTTGVPGLDVVLGGGLEPGSVTVLAGAPGAGKTILAQQMCFANANAKRKAVYYTTLSEPHSKLVRHLEPFDFFTSQALGQGVEYLHLGDLIRDDRPGRMEPLVDEVARKTMDERPAMVVIDSAKALATDLPATAWTRRSAGDGSKGPRFYDWAWLADVGADGDPDDDGRHSLLIRRNSTTGELAFYRCWTPGPVTLSQLVRVAGVRWIVEESFQAAKGQVGLDQHQVRRWRSWHRFTTLALAALAVLAICAADARSADHPAQPDLIELTVNEIRRLINVLLIRPSRSIAYRLRWSNWRRRHQARARRAHYTRRLTLELQP